MNLNEASYENTGNKYDGPEMDKCRTFALEILISAEEGVLNLLCFRELQSYFLKVGKLL